MSAMLVVTAILVLALIWMGNCSAIVVTMVYPSAHVGALWTPLALSIPIVLVFV
jgi:hypothetical protein